MYLGIGHFSVDQILLKFKLHFGWFFNITKYGGGEIYERCKNAKLAVITVFNLVLKVEYMWLNNLIWFP